MRGLNIVDVTIGTDTGHFHLVPLDVARPQLPQAEVGVGRSFIDVAPRGGLAILDARRSVPTIDVAATQRVGGVLPAP